MSSCPPASCCCLGDVLVKQGEIAPLTIDWTGWLGPHSGYNLFSIANIQLLDLNLPNSPPVLLPLIDLIPTLGLTPTPPESWFQISGKQSVFRISVSSDTPINSLYRLNFTAIARDCDGKVMQRTECLVIRIVACY